MYHKLLEEQYLELAKAIDELAERIRMLGAIAPATLRAFLELASLKEGNPKLSEKKMVEELAFDNATLVTQLHELIALCDEKKDQGTSDLLIERIRAHDKNAWILRSHLTQK